MILTQEQLAFYRDNGFLIVKDLFSKDFSDNLFKTAAQILKKYNVDFDYDTETKEFDADTFNKVLTDLRAKDPKIFGFFYDDMQVASELFFITMNETTRELAAQLINVDPLGLSATGHMLRMDTPNDSRNKLGWHQDCSYYPFNSDGDNGLVCWIPLHNVNQKNGTVKACPGSHKEGKVEFDHVSNTTQSSEQYLIPKEVVSKYDMADVEINKGDMAFFHMDLVHRSGDNSSDQIRFVAGVRYHNMLDKDYASGRFAYNFKKKVS